MVACVDCLQQWILPVPQQGHGGGDRRQGEGDRERGETSLHSHYEGISHPKKQADRLTAATVPQRAT